MRPKSMFYVCAGLLLLALAFGAGASRARGDQYLGAFYGTNNVGSPLLVEVTPDGRARILFGDGWRSTIPPALPLNGSYGTSIVVFTGYHAITDTGYIWELNGGNLQWRGLGFVGSPTQSSSESWGGVKARYR